MFSENHVFGKAPVWIGEENHVNLITPKKIRILVPYGGKNAVQAEVEVEISMAFEDGQTVYGSVPAESIQTYLLPDILVL